MRTPRSSARAACTLALGMSAVLTVGVILPVAAPASSSPLAVVPAAQSPAAESDSAQAIGLAGVEEVSARLAAVAESSDRVSVEVVGRSVQGRDIHLVTVTAPETTQQAEQHTTFRTKMTTDPEGLTVDAASKVPVMITANVHGDEREGTDAALHMIEEYASATDAATRRVLQKVRIALMVSVNPDGRAEGTRDNAAGFDLNRDLLTSSQPEAAALSNAIVEHQPSLLLDIHGYANGTLIEPTTAPFGKNIEFDLQLKHSIQNALGMEQDIIDLGYDASDDVRPPQIPLRDWTQGWDGWAPIFTSQYAALHGTVAHTIELPEQSNHAAYDLPSRELRRRTEINIDIAQAAIKSTVGYAAEHRKELLTDQIEMFRRGGAGEPARAADPHGRPPSLDGVSAGDDAPQIEVVKSPYPRAFVIPAGRQQRSAAAADALVEHLLTHGVQVQQTTRPVRIGASGYPTGSYLIDMHQARRGVAATMLRRGDNASYLSESMYDISAWSLGALWGARVVTVADDNVIVGTRRAPAATIPHNQLRSVQPGKATSAPDIISQGPPWRLPLRDLSSVRAMNALIERGVDVELTPEGTSVIVPAGDEAVTETANELGVTFHGAGQQALTGTNVKAIDVAALASAQEIFALREMGFDVEPVTTADLRKGWDGQGTDVLYVSKGLRWSALNTTAREALTDYLAGGGGLLARGQVGATLNEKLALLEVKTHSASANANGVVTVTSAKDGLAAGSPRHTFVVAPLWFTNIGENVVVDQRYAGANPLVSGHWRPSHGASDGPGDAAGRALVVHGVDTDGETKGARVALFGSDPLFRAHPKGQYPLVARALLWASRT